MRCLIKDRWLLLSLLLLMSPMAAFSDVPSTISYNGQLLDKPAGTPTNGTVNLIFNLYEDADGDGFCDGTPSCTSIWTEEHSVANGNTEVTVTNGLFSVALGSLNTTAGTTLGELKFDVPYLLGITVGADDEMGTLLRLSSVPTALRAENTKGSSVTVDCTSTPTGGKIQAALNAGATTISIDGVCTEAVNITRSGVVLQPGVAGAPTNGIAGPSDGFPALQISHASQVNISGLTLSEDLASTDESCVQVTSRSNVTFDSVVVEDCSDIGVQALLKSTVIYTGTANSITATNVGLELVAGASASISNMTISGFSGEGVAVIGSSYAYFGDAGAAGVTISAIATDATGLLIEGSSAVEMEGAVITSTNGNGATISGKSNLTGLGDGAAANAITGGNAGIVVLSGSVQLESGDISFSSVDANGV